MIRAVIFDMYETLITQYESPLYFGPQIAEDAKIPKDDFLALWMSTNDERSIGNITLEETLEDILRKNQCYTEKLLKTITQKRKDAKCECFKHLHPEIIPMLSELKKRGISIGLISNCFSEEAEAIRKSELITYFDAVFLSYEQGIQKPDKEIFQRCMNTLSMHAEECFYVGDGGSYELETAQMLGMTALQAVWYLKEGTAQKSRRKPEFAQLRKPLDVLHFLDRKI